MKQRWYLSDWFIGILFVLWPIFGIPLIAGIILLIVRYQYNKKQIDKKDEQIATLTAQNQFLFNRADTLSKQAEQQENEKIKYLQDQNDSLVASLSALQEKMKSLNASEYFEVQEKIEVANQDLEKYSSKKTQLSLEMERLTLENDKLNKSIASNTKKLSRIRELYSSIKYTLDNFSDTDRFSFNYISYTKYEKELDLISPSVILKLHSMDIKDLRKAFKDNDKQINELLNQYSSRYTTKANRAIYQLMVIALRAELQNILYDLKYEKLESSIDNVKIVTQKYLTIASDGNQSIANTLTKFIGQIEYLFINSVKIEYNYYVKKEQIKQEQQALREQMRQEAAERKALEEEKKKVEQEESKYQAEIEKVKSQMESASSAEIEILNAKIIELQGMLSAVTVKKDEITSLQNGKAGTVYIISNLGSFGENVFKVGMTRRLDPQDRVNELGDASVPFKFDVHSFIFSEDAVSLENKMHKMLESKRVNKVNSRKEFFNISIDELEQIVNEIEPTAEFNKTMLAEEYRQSQSIDGIYLSDLSSESKEIEETLA
ncbi:MAG: GIY-YIG nuclease family protein [Lachnospiraceae bacterium]|nr:GIY-YIG nuclease family protein [Lachnospiraceae bacterium]